jgi:hypothetical protein
VWAVRIKNDMTALYKSDCVPAPLIGRNPTFPCSFFATIGKILHTTVLPPRHITEGKKIAGIGET